MSEQAWSELEKAYQTQGLVLVLGAGVSKGCGLPNWETLVERLAVACLGENGGVRFRQLRDYGYGLPAIAGIIKAACPPGISFQEVIRSQLYADLDPAFRQGVRKDNSGAYVRYIRNCNPTLRTVASLCAQAKPGKRTFMANPLIHAVVTFNLDALLQAYVLARFHQRLLRTVERSSVKPYLDAINLYHLHGYLRFDRYSGDPSKEGQDTIVLTEQEYFDFFNSPTSMFNYTFLYLLREHPCLFIGLSMQDENLRRLLHYSCRERQSSFRGKQRREPHWLRHFALLQSTDYPDMDRLTEVSLNQLGVRTLWIKQFTDIPKRLGNVYESAGGSWQRVYGPD